MKLTPELSALLSDVYAVKRILCNDSMYGHRQTEDLPTLRKRIAKMSYTTEYTTLGPRGGITRYPYLGINFYDEQLLTWQRLDKDGIAFYRIQHASGFDTPWLCFNGAAPSMPDVFLLWSVTKNTDWWAQPLAAWWQSLVSVWADKRPVVMVDGIPMLKSKADKDQLTRMKDAEFFRLVENWPKNEDERVLYRLTVEQKVFELGDTYTQAWHRLMNPPEAPKKARAVKKVESGRLIMGRIETIDGVHEMTGTHKEVNAWALAITKEANAPDKEIGKVSATFKPFVPA